MKLSDKAQDTSSKVAVCIA